MTDSLGFLETHGLTSALVALDVMAKSAGVRPLQIELNDLYGVCVKIAGSAADVQEALQAGAQVASRMDGRPVTRRVTRPAAELQAAIVSKPEFNPLIQQNVVFSSGSFPAAAAPYESTSPMNANPPSALGFIETQGFTAVFEAIDTACKAANVEVVGKEKLGGGYVTVVIAGDLSAVSAAVQAGQAKVDGLGKLIAAHVVARPSPAILSLLPRLS